MAVFVQKNVHDKDIAVQCDLCEIWIHIKGNHGICRGVLSPSEKLGLPRSQKRPVPPRNFEHMN